MAENPPPPAPPEWNGDNYSRCLISIKDHLMAPAQQLKIGLIRQHAKDFSELARYFNGVMIHFIREYGFGADDGSRLGFISKGWEYGTADEGIRNLCHGIEDALHVKQAALFGIELPVDAPLAPHNPEIPLQAIHWVTWKLIKAVESRAFKFESCMVNIMWAGMGDEYLEYARMLVDYNYIWPAMTKIGCFGDCSCRSAAMTNCFSILTAYLKGNNWDAPTNGFSWRLERALQLPEGHFAGVKMEETGGENYPPLKKKIEYIKTTGWWEDFKCDQAYTEEAKCFIMPPAEPDEGPCPVLLFLLGMGHFDRRNPFTAGDLENIVEHEYLRRKFYMIVPKPATRNGMAMWMGIRYQKDWNPDSIWCTFTEMLRRLGPEKVDPGRLYLSGISQGGAGTWSLMLKYGQYFACCAPMGGACQWPFDYWPKGEQIKQSCLDQLRSVDMRHTHVDCDNHAPPPDKDIEYLARGLDERSVDVQFFGFDGKKRYNVQIRQWLWDEEDPHSKMMEYWKVEGPLIDGFGKGFWANDKHQIWMRIWRNWYWGFTDYFLKHYLPYEKQWHFDDKPFINDSSEHKKKLTEMGYFEPREKEINQVRNKTDVDKLVAEFRKELEKQLAFCGPGWEVNATFDVKWPEQIDAYECRMVTEPPWDMGSIPKVRPGVSILYLRMLAAAGWYGDCKKYKQVGLAKSPIKEPPPKEPKALPDDFIISEADMEFIGAPPIKEPKPIPNAPITIHVFWKHTENAQPEGCGMKSYKIKQGSKVKDLKKMMADGDVAYANTFDVAPASPECSGPFNKIPGILPLDNEAVLNVEEHSLLEKCGLGMKIELILDPVSGMTKDFRVEDGSTAWELRFMIAYGDDAVAHKTGIGLPTKNPADTPEILADDLVLTKKEHSKLRLWRIAPPKKEPKAKAKPKA